jgi:serine/threonine-protein kinase
MAPEQLEGKEADGRTDIFALGTLVYEMVTGRRAFEGKSQASLIAAILECDSPSVAGVAPASLDRTLRLCLAKDPDDRWQSARDLKAELEWIAESGTGPTAPGARTRSPWREQAGWVAATALLLLAGIGWFSLWRNPQPVDRPLVRLNVDLGREALSGSRITTLLSPDGGKLVFLARDLDGTPRLAMRPLNQSQTTLLAGTENAQNPFFSPNGQWLGFFADGKLKKISVEGGAPVVLGDGFGNDRGASWGEDDTIIVSPNPVSDLLRFAAAGGTPEQLKGTMFCYWPQILPGGQAVLVTRATGVDTANVEVLSLQTGRTKVVALGGYHGRYLPSGHVVFVHDRVLFGVPFDLGRLETSGTPVPLLDDVADDDRIVSDPWGNQTFAGKFDFARNGSFIYLSGSPNKHARTLIWTDRSGNTQPLSLTLNRYSHPRISPDGKRLAVAAGSNIWVVNLQRNTPLRLTYRTTFNQQPEWSPDGQHLVYSGRSGSSFGIWWVRADGAGEPQQLLESQAFVAPSSISSDGTRIAFHKWTIQTGWDIWILPIDASDPDHPKPGRPKCFLGSPQEEVSASFSPDGRWIAYSSSESGTWGVSIRPFSGLGGPWRIDSSGWPFPFWSRDGRTLYYLRADYGLMEVAYSEQKGAFVAEEPRAWSPRSGMSKATDFAMSPDGKRAIVVVEPEVPSVQESNIQVTFLLNFFDELRRRAPTAGK